MKNSLMYYEIDIQGDSELEVPTLRGDRTRHKDSELHRSPCSQTSS